MTMDAFHLATLLLVCSMWNHLACSLSVSSSQTHCLQISITVHVPESVIPLDFMASDVIAT